VSFATIILYVASRVFVVVYFVIDSVRNLLVTPSYTCIMNFWIIVALIFSVSASLKFSLFECQPWVLFPGEGQTKGRIG
jgi:hypothetical protein